MPIVGQFGTEAFVDTTCIVRLLLGIILVPAHTVLEATATILTLEDIVVVAEVISVVTVAVTVADTAAVIAVVTAVDTVAA